VTGIRRQHLLRLRYGVSEPMRRAMIRVTETCRRLLGGRPGDRRDGGPDCDLYDTHALRTTDHATRISSSEIIEQNMRHVRFYRSAFRQMERWVRASKPRFANINSCNRAW
jgi:hypothetical protein